MAIDDMICRAFRRSKWAVWPFLSVLLPVLLLGCATTEPGGGAGPAIQDDVVCRVNGSEIRRSDVRTKRQQFLPGATFHASVDQANLQKMRRRALQELIDEELQYQDARRRELSADQEKIAREYERLTDRYGGGEAFEVRIKRSGIEVKEVMAALERNLLIAQVAEIVADSQREVSEEEMRGYFVEHADSFQLPRRAEVRQILIQMPPLARDPDDWKRAFEQAEVLRARVANGESFAKLAAEISHAPEGERAKGGPIGIVHPGQLESPLDTALWSLQPGEVSEPVRAFKGVYLLWMEKSIDARPLAYDEIEERLEKLLRKKQREQALEDWRASLRERAEIEIVDPSLAPVAEGSSQSH